MNAQRAAWDTREHPASGPQNDPQHKARHICCEADRGGSSAARIGAQRATGQVRQKKAGSSTVVLRLLDGGVRPRCGYSVVPHIELSHRPLLWFLPLP